MPGNVRFYRELAEQTAQQLTTGIGAWTGFLKTAARLYKYPYHEQLLIYAQRPDATACAEYDLWNNTMHRYVRRGSQGIALVDTSQDRPRLRYVFDVADTGERPQFRRLNLWEYQEQHENPISQMLSDRYGIEGGRGIEEQISSVVSQLVSQYWEDEHDDIRGILDESYLADYDEYDIGVAFRTAAAVSATYTILERCGLHPEGRFNYYDFQSVFDFNTPAAVSVLGTAISQISERVLRQIEVTIKHYEREQSAERSQHEQPELSEERGLPNPEPAPARDRPAPRQVREDAEEVPAGAPARPLESDDSERDPVPAPAGDRADRPAPPGHVAPADGESRGRDGGNESIRPAAVGGADEQPQGAGRGDSDEGADLRLEIEPAPFVGEQFSIFPSEAEQIQTVEEAESVPATPFAFSCPQEVIDQFLRYGSNSDNSRMHLVTEVSKSKSVSELAPYLSREFHGGYGLEADGIKYSACYAEDGIHIAKGTAARHVASAQIIPWADAAARVQELYQQGQLATNVELIEAPRNERAEIAEALLFMYRDLTAEAKEGGYLATMLPMEGGGFPEEKDRLTNALGEQEKLDAIVEDYERFADAYFYDDSLLRFHYHKPQQLRSKLDELSLSREIVPQEMAELPPQTPFITEDEVDAALANRGSGFEGGRGRIYRFFQQEHTAKEKADFLKNEYGIGGSSHALSGATHSGEEHDSKGIRYKKVACESVTLSWSKVARRIDDLIAKDRFLSPQEMEMLNAEAQAKAAPEPPAMWTAYNEIKEAHPDSLVLFQVGDFYELYGEDARNAAELFDWNTTTRLIPSIGRVELCGIPSHILNEQVEKLRDRWDVVISAENYDGTRNTREVLSIDHEAQQALDAHEAEFGEDGYRAFPGDTPDRQEPAPPPVFNPALTQDDIDDALRAWNGSIESKRAVVRYMRDHSRERGTAAWLSQEYGGNPNTPLHISKGAAETTLSWTQVQRRISQLIRVEKFYTEEEYDRMDDVDPVVIRERLANAGIVNGKLVDPDAQDRDPFIRQVMADAERIAAEEAEEQEESPWLVDVGDTVYLEDGKAFIVEQLSVNHIQLRDPTLLYPIFRSESYESFRRLMELYPQPAAAAQEEPGDVPFDQETERQLTAETVAFYPGEENNLPYDIEIRTLRTTPPDPPVQPPPENFRITDMHLGEGGPKSKFRANMDAIHTLKTIEAENRTATPEEQETLSRYVGWGGLADAFDESKQDWNKEYQELKDALTPEEYTAARGSTLNAHYTSPTVIQAIYDAVARMGFQSGNILEPSMGVGNFFGMLPQEMTDSKLYGVELDSITGQIAKQLYPQANITVAGFETTDRRDFYDLAIGNVPFGNYQVADRAYDKLGFSIHNYFFAKALDQVRPGGVVAFVTSRYTLDSKDGSARKYLAQRADFLGAIRLPNNAFKANAGTDVVSDIIFLQKRDRPIDIDEPWVHLGQNEDGFAINSYFVEHPEMILGRQASESTQYGRQDFTVAPIEGLELKDQLADAIQYIRGAYATAELPELGEGEEVSSTIPADPNVKNYSYTLVDGEVYYRENSVMVKPDLNATAKERVKGMVILRTCVQELIDLQMDEYTPESAIAAKQAELNELYDGFSARYGLINDRANRLAFADDSSYYLLCSLEVLDENNELERKADFFEKRTIKQQRSVDHVDTAVEALAVSIGQKAGVDLGYMAQLMGGDDKIPQIVDDLHGVIFKDPNTGPFDYADGGGHWNKGWQTADEYLSGNVRRKLRTAERIAESDPFFQINAEALKRAQPKDLDASEIEVRVGSTWIDPKYYEQFMHETFKTPYYMQRRVKINYSPYTAEWQIEGKTATGYGDFTANNVFGTSRANAYRLLEDALNLRDVRIYDTIEDPDGKERRVLNAKETTLAAQKQQAIREAFKDWIWKDPRRREALVRQYNEEMNSTRPREYDGSHLVFSGMNPEITLREHQKSAIAHVIYGGNTLLAHEVGAGKTFEMVAAAMESKRLGLCNKSLFVVPNHLTDQWAAEFLRLYPSANILVTTKKDFQPHNRKKFCARIATGDYDAVIIGHSQFEKIPISSECQMRLIEEQIEEITRGIEEMEDNDGPRYSIKQMEKTKRGLEARLKKLQDGSRKDDVVTFEQLGVDRLFVDESDNYKNLFLYTKMRNVAGLSTTDAQKSSDMFAKCRYMDELTGNRGVIFATGTPISNSMTEMYTIQRYLQYDRLQELGMGHFDCWASRFGETTTALELAPEGTGYRARTRFAKFFNLPELMNLFKEVADIKTADQLDLPTPEVEYHTYASKPTEIQKEMVKTLSDRASRVHSGAVDAKEDNMLKITSDGRKLGLDQRVIDPMLPDEGGTKVNQCVENILQFWRDGEDKKLTQLVFCDISTPKGRSTPVAAKAAGGNLDSPEIHALESMIPLDEPETP